MRALILAATLLAISAGTNAANAGLSTAPREMASVDTAAVPDEATPESEDLIGLTRTSRREVQRRLAKLGFETRVSGKFDESTRAAISRWQEENGYPRTGFLNTAQHNALLDEGGETEPGKSGSRPHVRSHTRRSHGIGGPIGAIGGAIGGLFHR
jgi:peptidoglycan hydrolase-like protein with peptidoglycan-binding domain